MGKTTIMSRERSTVSKVEARKTIERIPEIRSGVVDMKNSSAGYCIDPKSQNFGKVWTLLSLQDGNMVQYSSSIGDSLRKQKISLGANDDTDSKRHKLLKLRSNEGFTDLKSKSLPMHSWKPSDKYRGSKAHRKDSENDIYKGISKCSRKSKKSCKKSKKCTYKQGSYKNGKMVRKPSC